MKKYNNRIIKGNQKKLGFSLYFSTVKHRVGRQKEKKMYLIKEKSKWEYEGNFGNKMNFY